jgi:hypothetical protein
VLGRDLASYRHELVLPARPGHRLHRHLLPPHAGSHDARRGDRERAGPGREAGQGARSIDQNGLAELALREGFGLVVYSPLAQGLLTDKYLETIPEGARAQNSDFLPPDRIDDVYRQRTAELNKVAQNRGQSLAQLALQWVLRNPAVTSALIGLLARRDRPAAPTGSTPAVRLGLPPPESWARTTSATSGEAVRCATTSL